jgi:hypothetical protein
MYQIQVSTIGAIKVVSIITGGIVVTKLYLDPQERTEWQPLLDSVRTGEETIASSGIRNYGMGVPVS